MSKTKVFGLVHLDILLHFSTGLILTLLLRKKGFKIKKVFLIILALQIFKEFLDSFSMTASWHEAITDTLSTMIFPFILWMATILKEKAEKA